MHLQDHIKAVLRGHGIQKTPKAFFYTTELAELYLLPFTGMLLSNLLAEAADAAFGAGELSAAMAWLGAVWASVLPVPRWASSMDWAVWPVLRPLLRPVVSGLISV